MSELDQNLTSVTSEKQVMTERDCLREENQRLNNKIDSIVAMVLRLKLDKDTIINSVRELKNRLCGKLEVYSALAI